MVCSCKPDNPCTFVSSPLCLQGRSRRSGAACGGVRHEAGDESKVTAQAIELCDGHRAFQAAGLSEGGRLSRIGSTHSPPSGRARGGRGERDIDARSYAGGTDTA